MKALQTPGVFTSYVQFDETAVLTAPLVQSLIQSVQRGPLTGPTGPLGPTGFFSGTLSQNIVPTSDKTLSLGTPDVWFKNLYVDSITVGPNTINIGGAAISASGDGVTLPGSTTIGGVNPGTIVIKGKRNTQEDLPATSIVGDGYIIGTHLFVAGVENAEGEEWIDAGEVKGPVGDQGATGPIGPTGSIGPTGPLGIGATGPIGSTGAEGPQGPQGPLGLQGPAGPQGPQGPQGPAGQTVFNGAMGPTGLSGATGPKGDFGGPMGPTGASGPLGSQGATGFQGPSGLQGPVGSFGATGFAGPTGSLGATGPQGATGALGATGPRGATGFRGPGGATGAQGPAGTTEGLLDGGSPFDSFTGDPLIDFGKP